MIEKYSPINTYMKAALAVILTLAAVYICVVDRNLEALIGLTGTAVGYYFGKQSNAPSEIVVEKKDSIGQ